MKKYLAAHLLTPPIKENEFGQEMTHLEEIVALPNRQYS